MTEPVLSRQRPIQSPPERGPLEPALNSVRARTELDISDFAYVIADLRAVVLSARARAAAAASATIVEMYWQLGSRLRAELLVDGRAPYGSRLVVEAASRLSEEFGSGFSEASLRHSMRFVEVFPDSDVVSSLSRSLTWTHLRDLIPIEDRRSRAFYAEMARVQRWSTRRLRKEIDGMLYERTALSRSPEAVIDEQLDGLREGDRLTPELVFRDPYMLDFLGLPRDHSESDLEGAILRELESVLTELGDGFCFVCRQKRISVGPDDFYLDLLFYHRGLRRLVAIELKIGRFMPADLGQMLLYLRWLDKNEKLEGEGPPLGLILCSDVDEERVELLELADGSIRVARYLTELPPANILAARLHTAVQRARARLEDTGETGP